MTLFNPNPKRNTATTTALAPATTIAVPTHHPPLTALTTHYLPTSQWRQDKYIVIVANPNPNTATSSPTTVPLPLPLTLRTTNHLRVRRLTLRLAT